MISRWLCDLEFIQENHQLCKIDQNLDGLPTEDYVTCDHWPQKQSSLVNGQEESATRVHMLETEETFLHSHEWGWQEVMHWMQTVGISEATEVSDKQCLSQHPDDGIIITVSPNQNTS